MDQIYLASIQWDQKLGGVVQAVYPKLEITPNSAMNLYNMHRMRQTGPSFGAIRLKLQDGQAFNAVTFFSGFGGTSPDGFTANYGETVIGISERVFALFLPMNYKSTPYEMITALIGSRLLLDNEKIPERVKLIQEVIQNSGVFQNSDELLKFLEKYLDVKLKLSTEEKGTANLYYAKSMTYLVKEKQDHIKDLTINPAETAFCVEEDKISRAQEEKQKLQDLIAQVQKASTQKAISEAVNAQKDEVIEQLKEDYVKIFGTLTDQIMQLESEIKGISESTQAFVMDLNTALAEKIQKIETLEQQIVNLKNN